MMKTHDATMPHTLDTVMRMVSGASYIQRFQIKQYLTVNSFTVYRFTYDFQQKIFHMLRRHQKWFFAYHQGFYSYLLIYSEAKTPQCLKNFLSILVKISLDSYPCFLMWRQYIPSQFQEQNFSLFVLIKLEEFRVQLEVTIESPFVRFFARRTMDDGGRHGNVPPGSCAVQSPKNMNAGVAA